MTGIVHQLEILQRMGAFSAAVRGHELGEWHAGEGCALACCTRCHAELRVYYSPIQPEMDGEALNIQCLPDFTIRTLTDGE